MDYLDSAAESEQHFTDEFGNKYSVVCCEQVTEILNFRFLQFLKMTKFAMVGIFLFIPLTLVMCSTSIKVGHFLGGEVSSRVLGSEGTLHTKFPKTKSISSHGKLEKQADQGIKVSCIILIWIFVFFRSASLFSSAKIG